LYVFQRRGKHPFQYGSIVFQEIQSRIAGLLRCAGCQDDNIRIPAIPVIARPDPYGFCELGAVIDIHGFPFCVLAIGIDQYDLRGKSTQLQGIGTRGAYASSPDDGDPNDVVCTV
jgi:hypothetical protein